LRQLSLTPAAGKRLIGKAIAKHSEVLNALKGGKRCSYHIVGRGNPISLR